MPPYKTVYGYFAAWRDDGTTERKAWVDGGYNQKVVDHGAELGIDVEVVRREPGTGFKVLPRRWVAERMFGWFMLHRRLARGYETHQESSRTMIHWSIIGIMARALTRAFTPSWQDSVYSAT